MTDQRVETSTEENFISMGTVFTVSISCLCFVIASPLQRARAILLVITLPFSLLLLALRFLAYSTDLHSSSCTKCTSCSSSLSMSSSSSFYPLLALSAILYHAGPWTTTLIPSLFMIRTLIPSRPHPLPHPWMIPEQEVGENSGVIINKGWVLFSQGWVKDSSALVLLRTIEGN